MKLYKIIQCKDHVPHGFIYLESLRNTQDVVYLIKNEIVLEIPDENIENYFHHMTYPIKKKIYRKVLTSKGLMLVNSIFLQEIS